MDYTNDFLLVNNTTLDQRTRSELASKNFLLRDLTQESLQTLVKEKEWKILIAVFKTLRLILRLVYHTTQCLMATEVASALSS